MQNIGFSDFGYVIKPPQPSSAIYGAPPSIGHRLKWKTREVGESFMMADVSSLKC